MTEPTDAEIEALFVEETGFAIDDFPAAILDFARAALAKWGTPPVVVGDPVGWLDDGSAFAGSHRVITNETKECMPKRLALAYSIPLYTTPQPTQAQAGAVPLTDEQIDAVAESMPGGLDGFLKGWGWRQFAREILTLRRMPDWEPQFDCMTPKQEELAVQFCQEIAGPRGKRGSPPDPVRLLEMAEALYKAEREARHGIKGGQHGADT